MAIIAKTSNLYPNGPRNVFCVHPFVEGALDIRFDNPTIDPDNKAFDIIGVHVYKSPNSEFGPYIRLTETPIQTLTYRDRVTNELIVDEDVTSNFVSRGDNERGEYIFKTQHRPIVKDSPHLEYASDTKDIVVKIDTGDGQLITTPIYRVIGSTGEVFLITSGYYDHTTRQNIPARLPDFNNPSSKVLCTYRHNTNRVTTRIDTRIFYKVTTVATRKDTGEQVETPINQVEGETFQQVERINWIWREAIRRNRWILQQAGERVKVFIRKWMGTRCPDWSDTHKRSYHDCPICYGTGYVGGYVGPFDIIIAPPEAERNLELGEPGLRLNFAFTTWTGPSPLLSQRDFIVRPNGERFGVGSITPEGAHGAIFQQHFDVQYIDTKDVRYKVPIYPEATIEGPIPEIDNTREPPGTTSDSPVITDKPEIPDKREIKGRTITFENIEY